MSGSNVNLVIAGDSIGAGSISGADPWNNLDLGGTYTVQNHSFAGAYIGQQAGLNEAAVLQSYDPNSGTNWLVVQAGTNDLAQGASASVLYTGVAKLVEDGHAQGFKVVVATVLPRSDAVFAWSSADESARLAYNDTVRANAAGADAIADIAASPIMGNAAAPSNAALYLDGLHPTASAVQTYLEPIYAAVFSSSAAPAPIAQPDATPAPVITTPPETTPAAGDAAGADTGSGSNTLVVHVSGDHYQGDPQFQVYVDGKQVGGTQTVSAVHSQNQWQDITLKGDFSPGSPHAVEVRFVNDAYDGSGQFTEGHDRNLYVGSVSLDGHSFGASEANPTVLLQNGGVTIATTAPADTTGTGDTSPSAGAGSTAPAADPASTTTVGSGAHQLVLKISQDAYLGDAQYVVSVDGNQVGGVQTAHASHAAGQSDTLTVKGDFGPGDHTVNVNFLNDFYGGSAGADRNLYVDGASYDGKTVANSSLTLPNTGSLHFTIPGTGTGSDGSGAATVATTAAAVPAPTVALTHDTGAGGAHVSADGQITYTPSVSGDTLHYKLDNGAVTTTAPVLATDGTADGSHTVTVYETDAAGHTSADASLVFSLQTHHDNTGFHLT